jgi:hypothetical protein
MCGYHTMNAGTINISNVLQRTRISLDRRVEYHRRPL